MGDDVGRGISFYTADPRSVLPLDELHCPRSLRRALDKFDIRVDGDCPGVIRGCATRRSTWINGTIIDVYTELHELGKVHSLEAWQDGRLAGGLYGVVLGGAFFGESMFTRVPEASKVCVVRLVERLRERGFILLDCQQQTAHMARFGARLIPMSDYFRLLERALALNCSFTE